MSQTTQDKIIYKELAIEKVLWIEVGRRFDSADSERERIEDKLEARIARMNEKFEGMREYMKSQDDVIDKLLKSTKEADTFASFTSFVFIAAIPLAVMITQVMHTSQSS
jgi:hypothetical protein